MRFSSALACAALVGASGLASADRFDPRRVAQGAAWVAHVDVERLAASELYSVLSEGGTLRLEDQVEELAELGVDPLKDLKSVTLYGVGERSVVMLLGNERLDGALERLKAAGEYRREELDGKPLHVFGEDCWVAVLAREGSTDRLVVQADDRASVKLACDVLEGRARSLGSSEAGAKRFVPGEGSMLFAAANERLEALDGLELGSNVVRLAEELVLDLGEARGELFASLALTAKDAREATQLLQVLQGATALVGLVAGEDPEVGRVLRDLVGGLRFSTEGERVRAEFRMSTRLLLDHLRALEVLEAEDKAPEPRRREKSAGK